MNYSILILIYLFTVQQQQPDAFGDLLGNMGMPPPVVLQPNVSTENVVEDIQPGRDPLFYSVHIMLYLLL
jgi:hypothetical protein